MSIRNKTKHKLRLRASRHRRVRASISQSLSPRLCVFRSNKHILAQLIDDKKGVTLAVCGDNQAKKDKNESKGDLSGKCAVAFATGVAIADKAREMKIKKVVFDRGGYRYHGRVKSLAEGARKGGLEF